MWSDLFSLNNQSCSWPPGNHFFIACGPIPQYFLSACWLARTLCDTSVNQSKMAVGIISNELGMGGMKALLGNVFLSWAGPRFRCGARLTCTLQKFMCALIDLSWDKEALCLVNTQGAILHDVSLLIQLIMCAFCVQTTFFLRDQLFFFFFYYIVYGYVSFIHQGLPSQTIPM